MTDPTPCAWREDGDGIWTSSCDEYPGGKMFEFTIENGPNEANFRYCPYCGRPLVEVAFLVIPEDNDV